MTLPAGGARINIALPPAGTTAADLFRLSPALRYAGGPDDPATLTVTMSSPWYFWWRTDDA